MGRSSFPVYQKIDQTDIPLVNFFKLGRENGELGRHFLQIFTDIGFHIVQSNTFLLHRIAMADGDAVI